MIFMLYFSPTGIWGGQATVNVAVIVMLFYEFGSSDVREGQQIM